MGVNFGIRAMGVALPKKRAGSGGSRLLGGVLTEEM
jgi:hypothetical protein